MPTEPALLLYYGDDHFAITEAVKQRLSSVGGDPTLVEMNITRLDGRTCNDSEVRTAAHSLPFLAERRLVVLNSPQSLLGSEVVRARFQQMLDSLPPTTTLILTVEDVWEHGKWMSMGTAKLSWLLKWAAQAGERALVQEKRLPGVEQMPDWILEAARKAGGAFERGAAKELAGSIGADKAQAVLEIDKLLNYVNFSRPVQVDDVQALTPSSATASIFTLVDAMGSGDRRKALRELEVLLQEQDAFSIFGMIVRQVRLLIITRDALDAGVNPAPLLKEYKIIYDRQLANLNQQARRFSLAALMDLYRRLLELDEKVKTSRIPFELGLEMFITEGQLVR